MTMGSGGFEVDFNSMPNLWPSSSNDEERGATTWERQRQPQSQPTPPPPPPQQQPRQQPQTQQQPESYPVQPTTSKPFKRPSTLVDLDDELTVLDLDDSSLVSFDSEDESGEDYSADDGVDFKERISAVLLKNDVHQIPGSPWAKPQARHSRRPKEPLSIAKYASSLSLAVTLGWVVYLFIAAVWTYSSLGRIIVECILAVLTFFGLFWNAYFTVSSVFKCFIPKESFLHNSKYFSVIPEQKHPQDDWMAVTIQIPVYKESLADVLGPTLESCMAARDHYQRNTRTDCNIVVCDDGIMNMLRDNFPAAEMLWDNVVETKGRITNINLLLKKVPYAARRHLKGLRSKNIVEVFHRMLFYYHHKIGWVARSTLDRRGKFKKAGNLNTHLRLVFGAQQQSEETNLPFEECLLDAAHNDDGSREIMFGNNINIGGLICVNDADARMQPPVIMKTVPEFLNDKFLGFTQHATKTMDEQRGESYFLRMIEVYTDALYQGHFLLSSILGCHPPLVGHSVFLRTDAVRQCGRMRMLKKAQRWLDNIGLPFLGVDQIGFGNLQSEHKTEYWSEAHVSEDFELMIHLYNLGYSGRYIAFPDCEFQEGVTRTFDEEAGRHRKFSLGAHELMFNPIQDWIGHGIHTSLFRTFLTCDMPSYYKIFLTAYLQSYSAGGIYIFVFVFAALMRLVGHFEVDTLWSFSPVGVLVLNIVVYYVVGYTTFLIALARMHYYNKDIFFKEYRERSKLYLVYKKIRYAMTFQCLFYSIMGNYFFLGALDHLMSRPKICAATNKDSIDIKRCEACKDVVKFNSGSFGIAAGLGALAVAVLFKDLDWDYEAIISGEEYIPSLQALMFSCPTLLMSILAFLIPFILNPFVFGCFRRGTPHKKEMKVKLHKKETNAVQKGRESTTKGKRSQGFVNESNKPRIAEEGRAGFTTGGETIASC